jgi:hypothetical protein
MRRERVVVLARRRVVADLRVGRMGGGVGAALVCCEIFFEVAVDATFEAGVEREVWRCVMSVRVVWVRSTRAAAVGVAFGGIVAVSGGLEGVERFRIAF